MKLLESIVDVIASIVARYELGRYIPACMKTLRKLKKLIPTSIHPIRDRCIP